MIFLGQWMVNDVKPNANGEAQEVKMKVRINNNGVILVSSAHMVERKEPVEAEQQNGEIEAAAVPPAATPNTTADSATDAAAVPGEPMETQEVS